MISIFSNYLSPLGEENCGEEIKPSELYRRMRIAYNQGALGVLESTRMITSQSDDDDDDCAIIYETWRNSDLHTWLVWMNRKITLQLGLVDYRTIGVRLRIATGMLNKQMYDGSLSKKFNQLIHNNLVKNVEREMAAINTEDLPF